MRRGGGFRGECFSQEGSFERIACSRGKGVQGVTFSRGSGFFKEKVVAFSKKRDFLRCGWHFVWGGVGFLRH